MTLGYKSGLSAACKGHIVHPELPFPVPGKWAVEFLFRKVLGEPRIRAQERRVVQGDIFSLHKGSTTENCSLGTEVLVALSSRLARPSLVVFIHPISLCGPCKHVLFILVSIVLINRLLLRKLLCASHFTNMISIHITTQWRSTVTPVLQMRKLERLDDLPKDT